jgi:hypothetical protein
MHFREATVLVPVAQVRRAYAQETGNFGRAETPQGFTLFGFEGDLHLPIQGLGQIVGKCADVRRAYALRISNVSIIHILPPALGLC